MLLCFSPGRAQLQICYDIIRRGRRNIDEVTVYTLGLFLERLHEAQRLEQWGGTANYNQTRFVGSGYWICFGFVPSHLDPLHVETRLESRITRSLPTRNLTTEILYLLKLLRLFVSIQLCPDFTLCTYLNLWISCRP